MAEANRFITGFFMPTEFRKVLELYDRNNKTPFSLERNDIMENTSPVRLPENFFFVPRVHRIRIFSEKFLK